MGGDQRCFVHTTDHAQKRLSLKAFSGGAALSFTRGLAISAELLRELIKWAPLAENGRRLLQRAEFNDATFGNGANFHGAAIGDGVTFYGATFGNGANFTGVTFGDDVSFHGASFGDDVSFHGASFGDDVSFNGATFGDRVIFYGATFGNKDRFVRATFGDGVSFYGATFGNRASFNGATFGNEILFNKATFGNETLIIGATFGDPASFVDITFGDRSAFGPVIFGDRLVLDRSVFGQRPEVNISADSVHCVNLKATDGGLFEIHGAEVVLDGADFARHTVIAGAARSEAFHEPSLPEHLRSKYQARDTKFQVLSLRDCDLRQVVFSNVDLTRCRFAGAYSLDQLGLEPITAFLATPTGLVKFGWALPPVWRWGKREHVIAEEHEWRAAQRKGSGWDGSACGTQREGMSMDRTRAAEIAAVYRSLRKGREDKKDEPGAADFYYAEMDMRRKAASPMGAERLVLSLYWLTSGYALRSGRALAAFLVVVFGFAWLLDQHGFSDPESFWPALTYSAGSATAIFGGLERQLTTWGEAFRIVLRIIGPVLLGLVALSLRGRVKR